MQRKLALKAFLESSGFKIFLVELNLLHDKSDFSVINRYKKPVDLNELAELNYDLGEKSGFSKILAILESFKEELLDKSS